MQVWLLQWVCISPVICRAKDRLFASFFFQYFQMNKASWIVIKHATINPTFTGTKGAMRLYIIYINDTYAELRVKKLKNKAKT